MTGAGGEGRFPHVYWFLFDLDGNTCVWLYGGGIKVVFALERRILHGNH